MKVLRAGEEMKFSRSFTHEDIINFSKISKDMGIHHVDDTKKLLVHGLLLATLPTKLGGDLNFIASRMDFHFIAPAYENDIIECRARLEKIVDQKRRIKCEFSFKCINQNETVVMEGVSSEMIWKDGYG